LVAVGSYWLAGADDPDASQSEAAPTVTSLDAPTAAPGRCMVITADLLRNQTLAFDGSVTGIAGGVATLEVTTWYAGGDTDVVEVNAPAADLTRVIGAPQFEVGERYLVAATDEKVAVCGMSATYSEELAALYAEAFDR
jgi:hypothetical protein